MMTRPSDHTAPPRLSVRDLHVHFNTAAGTVEAVSGVTFDINAGESVGLVGESGCGKSTLLRALIGLEPVTRGDVRVDGVDLGSLSHQHARRARSSMQMIFQDPRSSLNPRRHVRKLVGEGAALIRGRAVSRAEVADALLGVGLEPELFIDRRPGSLSGGQAQRVSIARALMMRPNLLLCDEAVSALDVSVQAQVLNLINEVRRDLDLSIVFVGHDLAVVRYVCDRIAVMYLGVVCELAPVDTLFASPQHHYTRLLLSSVIGPDTPPLASEDREGELPSPLKPPTGCRFRTRCAAATDLCAARAPDLIETTPGHFVACHHPAAANPPINAGPEFDVCSPPPSSPKQHQPTRKSENT